MKIALFLGVTLILGTLFYLPTALTGQVARIPQPYPGISPVSLEGDIYDSLGQLLPAGRLAAYSNGQKAGEGGVFHKYTLTLYYGWHEQPPLYDVTYYNYNSKEEYYCTTIDLTNLPVTVTYKDDLFVDLHCQFDASALNPPPRQSQIITMGKGDIAWIG